MAKWTKVDALVKNEMKLIDDEFLTKFNSKLDVPYFIKSVVGGYKMAQKVHKETKLYKTLYKSCDDARENIRHTLSNIFMDYLYGEFSESRFDDEFDEFVPEFEFGWKYEGVNGSGKYVAWLYDGAGGVEEEEVFDAEIQALSFVKMVDCQESFYRYYSLSPDA